MQHHRAPSVSGPPAHPVGFSFNSPSPSSLAPLPHVDLMESDRRALAVVATDARASAAAAARALTDMRRRLDIAAREQRALTAARVEARAATEAALAEKTRLEGELAEARAAIASDSGGKADAAAERRALVDAVAEARAVALAFKPFRNAEWEEVREALGWIVASAVARTAPSLLPTSATVRAAVVSAAITSAFRSLAAADAQAAAVAASPLFHSSLSSIASAGGGRVKDFGADPTAPAVASLAGHCGPVAHVPSAFSPPCHPPPLSLHNPTLLYLRLSSPLIRDSSPLAMAPALCTASFALCTQCLAPFPQSPRPPPPPLPPLLVLPRTLRRQWGLVAGGCDGSLPPQPRDDVRGWNVGAPAAMLSVAHLIVGA